MPAKTARKPKPVTIAAAIRAARALLRLIELLVPSSADGPAAVELRSVAADTARSVRRLETVQSNAARRG